VTLLERSDRIGGQLAVAALARMNHQYADWIEWQGRRLRELGVSVEFGREATPDHVLSRAPGVVVVATGARPRVPAVPGADLPHVLTSVAALTGGVPPGDRVIVVSEDDRAAPLAVADHLAGAGYPVTLIYQSPAPSPQVGKYSIGSVLARLDAEGVRLVPMARAVAFRPGAVELAHSYSDRRWTLDGADTVVLACGSVSDDTLYHELRTRHRAVHLLGDAYAPRRLSFATRQARDLVRAVLT
jgi:NADPH-dependent 2,4-dienoyl-CoA reductase/sulfur reductase-like enzyme